MKCSTPFLLAAVVMAGILLLAPVSAATCDSNSTHPAAQLTGTVSGSMIQLTWNAIASPDLQGYRVIISKNNPNPAYPDNGHLISVAGPGQTSVTIDGSSAYRGGDFGGHLVPGQSYYLSVTTLYCSGAVPGNSIFLTLPGTPATPTPTPTPAPTSSVTTNVTPVPTAASTPVVIATPVPSQTPDPGQQGNYSAPDLSGSADSGHVRLNWNNNADRRILGYRVLISRDNPDPRYNRDNDAVLATGRDQHSATLDTSGSYYGGDFGGRLLPGTYYIRVIAIYPDRVVHGRVVRFTVPDTTTPVQTQPADEPAPHLTGNVDGPEIRLNWNVITDSRFQGYKVVISKNNPDPAYPDDGYLYFITDRNQHTATVDTSSRYNGGDFGGHLVPGQSYYFSITALYSDRKVPGNTITLVCPGAPAATPTATPVVTATPTPQPTATPVVTETETPVPTEITPDPTITTVSPTPTPIPSVTETETPDPTETTPDPTVTTASPTPDVTPQPTPSVYDLIQEQNRKIDAQNQLIAEQSRKLAEQQGVLDRLIAFLRTIFRI